MNIASATARIWQMEEGPGPLVALALHDGHAVRAELLPWLALSPEERLREEDPFTGSWTTVAPTRIVALRSRFEVDLNRPRPQAVYRRPEDAWGLPLYRAPLPEEVVRRSLRGYDAFYQRMHRLLEAKRQAHGRFVVLDLHSYNHRRDGPAAAAADPASHPEINVGTGTMTERGRWARIIDRFCADLRGFDFAGSSLDVRENVKFCGGEFAAWVHRTFPEAACCLSVEVKKFFMDEWTGLADERLLSLVGRALAGAVPGLLAGLEGRRDAA